MSKRVILYDSIEEVSSRLRGTFVLYDKIMYYVRDVDTNSAYQYPHNFILVLEQAGTADRPQRRAVHYDDPLLQTVGIKLGYLNTTNNVAWYTYRIPNRQTRQGLSRENVHVTSLSYSGGITDFNALVRDAKVSESIIGTFPNPVEARRKLTGYNEEYHSVAFSRSFALQRDMVRDDCLLDFRGQTIGWETEPFNFKIKPEYKFVREELAENGIKCA